jgi:protein O-GlcNAc transferase
MVLRELGELIEAIRVGRRATELNPDLFEAWHNLGNVYKDIEVFHEATACYANAIQINPECAVTHVGMGVTLHRKGETEKAVQSFERALALNASEGTAISNLYNISMMDCDWEKADYYKRLIHDATIKSLSKGDVPSETPFLNLVRCDDSKMNFAVARAWSRDIENRMSGMRKWIRFQYSKKPEGKIRIGYLSNNFGDHPTAHITRRLYDQHDRSRFEIFCYSYGENDNSCYRKAIQDGCDAFVDIRKFSHVQAAKRINDDGINILVDLVGYLRGGRIAIAALRPAPIQVRWLGMAGTSGATFFDYLITDKMVTPENQSRFYSEAFVYLPESYHINDNQPFIEKNGFKRSDFGLPYGAFVFCCFNTSYKIDATIFSSWMRILKQVDNSVLWIMAESKRLKMNLTVAAGKSGVNPKRLIFAEKIAKDKHLARLVEADIVLDTNRINGAASTSDALRAGVPVISVQGKHFASRMSSSILKAIGLNKLVVNNLKEYEERCVQLAENKIDLINVKRELIHNIKTTALFNTEIFVSCLERAYKCIWYRYLNNEKRKTTNIDN